MLKSEADKYAWSTILWYFCDRHITTKIEIHQTITTNMSRNPATDKTNSAALFVAKFLVTTQLEKKIGKFWLSIVRLYFVPTIFTYKLTIPKMAPNMKSKPMISFIFLKMLKVARPAFGNSQTELQRDIYFSWRIKPQSLQTSEWKVEDV